MSMTVTYWLGHEDKERCFQFIHTVFDRLTKGTAFEQEPAYITAYEVCKGLNEHYSDSSKRYIPLRDAHTGKPVIIWATADNIGKMIRWLREKHKIFYISAINLCIPLEDPLSMRVKRFWDAEDARRKQFEEYCKNDVAVTSSLELASVKKERDELKKQIDELNERIRNQEEIIKTQNESLTKQRKQLNDLGASLRDIKEVVDSEMDDLMAQHGDDIIPVF